MPYVRSNWEGLTPLNGGGKFEIGAVHSLTEVWLQRPSQTGPRGCFLHVTMESEARVSYLEMVISAKALEVYVLKGGQGASGEYVCVGRLEGRPAVDHPYKYHYRFGTTDLPDTKVALLQLRLTPHTPGAQEVYVFRFSVMVGEGGNARHKANIAASVMASTGAMAAGGNVAHLSESTSLIARPAGGGGGSGMAAGRRPPHTEQQMTVGRTAAQQQLALPGGGGGGEAAVVADALNDVMGKMLTVVTRKTKGYVGSTYKKTEDRIQARMRSMEAKIAGFEQVVGHNLERRLLDLEHVMATLNDRLASPRKQSREEGHIPGEEEEEGGELQQSMGEASRSRSLSVSSSLAATGGL